jgi:hypothetical protein
MSVRLLTTKLIAQEGKDLQAVISVVVGSGMYWEDLNHTIHSTPCEWHIFAWHQGENDCFSWQSGSGKDSSYTYLGDLTALVAAVQTEMFLANLGGQL